MPVNVAATVLFAFCGSDHCWTHHALPTLLNRSSLVFVLDMSNGVLDIRCIRVSLFPLLCADEEK
jgi:hypothetical protein